MPDLPAAGTDTADAAADATEAAAIAADARLIRSVRWRLVAWSGGVTLLVLVVIGVMLYVAVERSLAASSIDVLQRRAAAVSDEIIRRPRAAAGLGLAFGLALGGPSGTITLLVGPDGQTVVNAPRGLPLQPGLPVSDSVASAQADGAPDLRTTTTADGTPIRVLSRPIDTPLGTFVVQLVQSRADEQRTLDVTVRVLLAGGFVAFVLASGVGALYASRAMVPIRTSLAGQRMALRRQREFAADASHELRTPLTVIRTSLEHLERHRDQPVREVGTALDDIRAEVAQLTTLVDDLLLLARSDSGAVSLVREPVDLGDVAADAAASQTVRAAERGMRIEVDPEPAPVIGDPGRLRQLVVLLVDNGLKHGPPDGTVRVTVRRAPDGVTLMVDDDGPGIPPEHLDRVFDRFWRQPGASGDGTGLGLAIAHWIATQHGGTIRATNRPEGGARLTVRLPAAARVESLARPADDPDRPPPGPA
jgi:signal transduction histidine kinase